MMNQALETRESFLKNVFELGYTNAAYSLSKFVSDNVSGTGFHFGVYKLASIQLPDLVSLSRASTNLLLTTDIFGDISGRSYLLLSEQDIHVLTRSIGGHGNQLENLKEEFLKELDNILSASVITKISNELNMKVYGDIPILVGHTAASINSIIEDDFAEQLEEIYVNSAVFSFENFPDINPHFVWVMDGTILHDTREKKTVHKNHE